MRSIILLLSLLAIANPDGRKTTSLDGHWQIIVDPYESGFYDYRYKPSANGFFKDAKPKTLKAAVGALANRVGANPPPGTLTKDQAELFAVWGAGGPIDIPVADAEKCASPQSRHSPRAASAARVGTM